MMSPQSFIERNLYPHEIAETLVRAMNDDVLVNEAAQRNLELVRRLADRATIGPRVVAYYEDLAKPVSRCSGIHDTRSIPDGGN
jgi:hypothetical protein